MKNIVHFFFSFWRYSILYSVVFNFRHLPIQQAWKLPIWLRKPHIYKMKGRIKIEAPIKTGMIRLGGLGGHMYPDNGIHLTQMGGVIIFKGSCMIGNNSFICQGKESTITFGDGFMATTSIKLISFKSIEFGEKNIFGWGCVVMDTNFHPLYDIKKKEFRKGYGPIKIGDDNWFAAQCKIMHSVTTPKRCIFALGSTITKSNKFESFCVHGGNPMRILLHNVMLDYNHYMIDNYSK